MTDLDNARNDFPILGRKVGGRPLVYLDNAATAQVPEPVLERVAAHYRSNNANVHRAAHVLAAESTDALEDARSKVARFTHAPSPECVVFTSGTTAGINMAALGLGHLLHEGDRVIVTAMEHHSNFVPWQQMAMRSGADFQVVGFDEHGDIDLQALQALLDDPRHPVRIVAFTLCSNVLGTVPPASLITQMAHEAGAIAVADGAQAMRHGLGRLDVCGADLMAFSGHKMCAGAGIGALVGMPEALELVRPSFYGGEMVNTVSSAKSTWTSLPLRLEAGTPNYVGAIALGAAIDYLASYGCANIAQREDDLLEHCVGALRKIDGLAVLGTPERRCGCVSFTMDGVHPFDLAALLDAQGIAVRSGNNCAQPLLAALGVDSVVRISPAFYNTRAEIDLAVKAIGRAAELLRA